MACLIRTTTNEFRVINDYTAICTELRAAADDDWIEVQEQDEIQTRHMIRRSAILLVTELIEGPKQTISARILDTRVGS